MWLVAAVTYRDAISRRVVVVAQKLSLSDALCLMPPYLIWSDHVSNKIKTSSQLRIDVSITGMTKINQNETA